VTTPTDPEVKELTLELVKADVVDRNGDLITREALGEEESHD
jgi:hypothetical protein